MPATPPPPLAHRILWSLDDALFTVSLLHSLRRWTVRDVLRARRRGQQERQTQAAQRRAISQSVDYLQRAAYIVRQPRGQHRVWQLTAAGRLRALLSAARAVGHLRPAGLGALRRRGRRWIVLFDIPEDLRRQRTLLRQVLYGLQGRFVQRSAFLLDDADGVKLLRHIVRVAKLTPYVWIAEVR